MFFECLVRQQWTAQQRNQCLFPILSISKWKTTKKNYLILFQFCFDVCQDLQTFIQGDLNHATSLYMPIKYKNKNLYTPNQRQHLSVGWISEETNRLWLILKVALVTSSSSYYYNHQWRTTPQLYLLCFQ